MIQIKRYQQKGFGQKLVQVFMGYKMNMSYYTDSAMLQSMMEIPLEKKAGRLYAPPGKLQMIYFIDDLNMPLVGDSCFIHLHTMLYYIKRPMCCMKTRETPPFRLILVF